MHQTKSLVQYNNGRTMTTYLLHGGATSKENEDNLVFFGQFTKLVEKPEVKILLCYWARKKDEWQQKAEKDTHRITQQTSKKIIFHTLENPTDLFSKIKDYDVLYVAGGEPELLEPYYREIISLKQHLQGKVYAGSSMGAFLASEQYVVSRDSRSSDEVHRGIGLLPIQVLCHWDVETHQIKKLKMLRRRSNKPIITLNEYEFVRIYQ